MIYARVVLMLDRQSKMQQKNKDVLELCLRKKEF